MGKEIKAMDLYSEKSPSLGTKISIMIAETVLIAFSYIVLFVVSPARAGDVILQRVCLFGFNIVTFLRFTVAFFVFLKRKMPPAEAVSVPLAMALYYIGFPLLAVFGPGTGWLTLIGGLVLFFAGGFFNTFAEYQRHVWKKKPGSAGRLYTGGLFGVTRHPNYFGDIVWVLGYAVLTGNPLSLAIPALLFAFFYFYNIPLLEKHLKEKYKDEFVRYERSTKRLIPFIL